MKKQNSNQSGLTLVEILIVVSIIGLLSGVVLLGLNTARSKARDTRRKADLGQLQKALQLYENTHNSFPTTGGNCTSNNNWGGLADRANVNFKKLSGPEGWIPNLAPDFVSVLPVDPGGKTVDWSGYLYCSDGTSYKLLAHQTGPESFPIAGEPFWDPRRPNSAWMVCYGQTACDNW